MKYLLFDLSNEGHHYTYNYTVMKGLIKKCPQSQLLYYTKFKDACLKSEFIKDGIHVEEYTDNRFFKYMPAILLRALQLMKAAIYARKNKYQFLHLLYLDTMIVPLFLVSPLLRKKKITATLHWYPGRNSKRMLLKYLVEKGVISKLIVHGDYIKSQVEKNSKLSTEKVQSIVYPNLHSVDVEPVNSSNLSQLLLKNPRLKRPIMLCFGGLRYDKGLDILLEAAAKLITTEFTILIAGKEDTYTKDFIEKKVRYYGLDNKVVTCLGYIPEEDVSAYFDISDIIILPYRKMFSGQSGPLTEGATRGKIVIGPDHGEIGYTIQKYNLGVVFKAEDISDLSDKINYAIDNMNLLTEKAKNSEYKELIKTDVFQESYYEQLMKSR